MKRSIKRLCVLLLAVFCLSMFSGCGEKPADVPQDSAGVVLTAGLHKETDALVKLIEPEALAQYDAFRLLQPVGETLWAVGQTDTGEIVAGQPDSTFTLLGLGTDGTVQKSVAAGLNRLAPQPDGGYQLTSFQAVTADRDDAPYLYWTQALCDEQGNELSREHFLSPIEETGLGTAVQLAVPEGVTGILEPMHVTAGNEFWLLATDVAAMQSRLLAFSLPEGSCTADVLLPEGELGSYMPLSMLTLADGRLLLSGGFADPVSGNISQQGSALLLAERDGNTLQFAQPLALPEELLAGGFNFAVQTPANTAAKGVYLWNFLGLYYFEENETVKIYDWVELSVDPFTVTDFWLLPEDRLLLTMADQTLRLIEPVADGVMSERTVVTLGIVSESSMELDRPIELFNAGQTEVLVEVINYTREEAQNAGYASPTAQLEQELLQGKAPDILILPAAVQTDNLVSKGAFLDLYPLLDADAELSREDFVASVLAACEYENTLPLLLPVYSLRTVAGDPDEVGTRPGMTWAEHDALRGQYPGTALYYGFDRSAILLFLQSMGGARFVDYAAGEAYFDTPEFAAFLQACGEYPQQNANLNLDPKPAFSANDALLKIETRLTFDTLRQLTYEFDGPVVFKGFPNDDSGSGSAINAELCVGINSFCTNPEAAWSFVRTLLLPENQQVLAQNGFPLRRDTLEQMALLAQQPAELPELPVYFQHLRDDPENEAWDYFSRGLTPEESTQIVSLIEATDVLYRYDAAVAAILAEEAAQYYSGVRTAEEAAALIQNRVQTYLAEQG